MADWQRHEVNTESTYWSESRQLNRYVYIIRVFYVLGEPAHQKIGKIRKYVGSDRK